ncbi:hypothetical protein [Tengunoibacter tsumagoiensis]|uniref:Uncharacterized protein n=1 Tax=Tengunoibacter tsumagoiensis TaxID=2014871 RepID=A0A401ZWT3_9CHLR|nr:hypothetical protein [Tengunoibacter tsumagoiensis]GCE11379.1 hypothetical protein KTT_12380 [Tengunoibacter tsumagoiensis]
MTTFSTVMGSFSVVLVQALTSSQQTMVALMLWITGFLCLLNIFLAFLYRGRKRGEVVSYYAAFAVELVIFVLALLLQLHITSILFHLPPGLPISQAEIGAALAIGIGLFPAAYWHRVNLSELPRRIAEDGQNLKKGEGAVKVRNTTPGEWMN